MGPLRPNMSYPRLHHRGSALTRIGCRNRGRISIVTIAVRPHIMLTLGDPMKVIDYRGLRRTPVPEHPAAAHRPRPCDAMGSGLETGPGGFASPPSSCPEESGKVAPKAARGDGGVAPESKIQTDLRGHILLLDGVRRRLALAPSGGKVRP